MCAAPKTPYDALIPRDCVRYVQTLLAIHDPTRYLTSRLVHGSPKPSTAIS